MYDFVPDPSNTIAARFKAVRIIAGHGLKRIADECCVSVKTVQCWERIGGIPAEALQVCAGLGMNPLFILLNSEYENVDWTRRNAERAVLKALGGGKDALLISRGYRAEIH